MIDEDLRETLQRRAETVAPSTTAGWTAVTRRIERRQRRTRTATVSLVGAFAFAAVAVAVVLVTNAIPDTEQNLAATGGSAPAFRPTTTYGPTTTLLGALDPVTGEPLPVEAGPAIPSTPTTIGSLAATGPVDPGVATTAAGGRSIYPETAEELKSIQAQVAEGHQPWWVDSGMVATSYLGNRGLTVDGAPSGLGLVGVVHYTAGGVGGWVSLGRVADGSIYYVEGSRSERIVQLRVTRQGDRLAVDVMAATGGKVVVRTKRPGYDWNPATSQAVAAGKLASLTVEGGGGTDLIVQVRHEGDDGKVGLSEQLLGAAQTGLEYEGIHEGSRLGLSSLGPVRLGLTLLEAQRVAGVATTIETAPGCASVVPVGAPSGVAFVSTAVEGDNFVDVITVDGPGVRTDAGVGVGSTVAEVRQAYPDLDERITLDGDGRLISIPEGDFVIVFRMVDGRVATIWSGADALADTDELCA